MPYDTHHDYESLDHESLDLESLDLESVLYASEQCLVMK